jgi:hypothetical protein
VVGLPETVVRERGQETALPAWLGLSGFEGRGSVRSCL